MRVIFVQFGDYREACLRFLKGGKENYYAQEFTVNWVSELAQKIEYVGVVCVASEPYAEKLSNNVRTFGLDYYKEGSEALTKLLEKEAPTHLIVCSPLRDILQWAVDAKIRVLPMLADSFDQKGIRTWFRNFLLKRILNNSQIQWVANHNINSCLSLKRIGVNVSKIIPWDFPAFITPREFPIKEAPPIDQIKLLYVGSVSIEKGVEECIRALATLKKMGRNATLTIAGGGDIDYMKSVAQDLGITSDCHFLGRISHEQILPLMVTHDVVLVPSRHEYPEGLPLTIYETFCSRTPLIASDHPMFMGKIIHEQSGLIFNAKDVERLTQSIVRLIDNPQLYQNLSKNSAEAWEKLQISTKWNELLEHWLRNDEQDKQWLSQRTLTHLTQNE